MESTVNNLKKWKIKTGDYVHEIVFDHTLKAAKERQLKEHGDKSVYQGVYKYSKGKGNNFYSFFVYSE